MVLVELFDSEPIENIAGFLITKPDKVVFFGEEKKTRSFERIFRNIAQGRNIYSEFECRPVNKNFLQGIVSALEDLVCNISKDSPEEKIVIDLCGGEDLMLVAAGIVYNMHPELIYLQRYDIYADRMTDCEDRIVDIPDSKTQMTLSEFVSVHGGCITHYEYKTKAETERLFTEELKQDVCKMWSICIKDSKEWNKNAAITARASNRYGSTLRAVADLRNESGGDIRKYNAYIELLFQAGIIKNLVKKKNILSFEFKNNNVKQCLVKAGTVLELYIASMAESLVDNKGKVYNEVMMGAQLDWDGVKSKNSGTDVANEIDVVLMRGLRPIFISCKNGSFLPEELYKLSAVAEHFGGRYVKKVLVTGHLSVNDNPDRKNNSNRQDNESTDRYMGRLKKQLLWSRASELGIEIVCKEEIENEAAVLKLLKRLYK